MYVKGEYMCEKGECMYVKWECMCVRELEWIMSCTAPHIATFTLLYFHVAFVCYCLRSYDMIEL